MRTVAAHVEFINPPEYAVVLDTIERVGRTCYKSEDKITEFSAEGFVRGLIKRGHEAMIEHGSVTLCFINDRGVSHEEVRHRIARKSLTGKLPISTSSVVWNSMQQLADCPVTLNWQLSVSGCKHVWMQKSIT